LIAFFFSFREGRRNLFFFPKQRSPPLKNKNSLPPAQGYPNFLAARHFLGPPFPVVVRPFVSKEKKELSNVPSDLSPFPSFSLWISSRGPPLPRPPKYPRREKMTPSDGLPPFLEEVCSSRSPLPFPSQYQDGVLFLPFTRSAKISPSPKTKRLGSPLDERRTLAMLPLFPRGHSPSFFVNIVRGFVLSFLFSRFSRDLAPTRERESSVGLFSVMEALSFYDRISLRALTKLDVSRQYQQPASSVLPELA